MVESIIKKYIKYSRDFNSKIDNIINQFIDLFYDLSR